MPGAVAQLSSDDAIALAMIFTPVIALLMLAMVVWIGAGFVYRERHLFAEAMGIGGAIAVLLGLIRLAAWGQSRPDEEALGGLFRPVGAIWLVASAVACVAWSRDRPSGGGPLLARPRTLPAMLLRYAAYNAIGYAVAGMLGLSVVLLITTQLAYSFIETSRATERAARPRGIDEVWDAEL